MMLGALDQEVAMKVARGVFAGSIAGIIASYAMDKFQALASPLLPSSGDEEDAEPATQKAADAISLRVAGRKVRDADKPLAGQSMHYAVGIGLGIAYGVAAEFRPSVTAGYGSAFGIGTATLLDEGAVPALGLGDAPWKADVAPNLYSYASHIVFGGVTELVRRQLVGTVTQ
jgi:putative membrane protein